MLPLAVRAIRICTLAVVPLGLQYTIIDGFTGMGMMRYSLPLSFFRKLAYFVPLFILPALFGGMAASTPSPSRTFWARWQALWFI